MHTCMSKNAVNCNSVTVELPSSKTIASINLISLHKSIISVARSSTKMVRIGIRTQQEFLKGSIAIGKDMLSNYVMTSNVR